MSNIIGFQRNREATQRLHELGYTSLIVYKEAWGWKVWDTNLSGCQQWNGLKRHASGCVSAVKRGVVPQEAPHIKFSEAALSEASSTYRNAYHFQGVDYTEPSVQ